MEADSFEVGFRLAKGGSLRRNDLKSAHSKTLLIWVRLKVLAICCDWCEKSLQVGKLCPGQDKFRLLISQDCCIFFLQPSLVIYITYI